MARNNPSNPYTRDPAHTAQDVPMPVKKAKVMSAGDHPEDHAFHSVTIRVYGDNAPYVAPVITPMFGSVWVPKEGQDVAVIFGESDKPWVIGAWYPVDRVEDGAVELPDYEAGDIRLGNESGSHATIHDDGSISLATGDHQVIDIEHHSGTAYQSSDYIVTTTDNYELVPFDTKTSDPQNMFDESNYEFNVRHDGDYKIWGQVEMDPAVDKTTYTLAIFVNGVEVKRKRQQGGKDAPLSVEVREFGKLDAGDTVDARFKTDATADVTLHGSEAGTDFRLERTGI